MSQVAGWCAPGACQTVFLNACDTSTFTGLFDACRVLWEHRGALVSSTRAQLVASLHQHVFRECRLQLWTPDGQQIDFDPE